MVTGPKNSGKSTFVMTLANLYVKNTPVQILDTDLGQPIFGVPGCVQITLLNDPVLSNTYVNLE